MTAAAVGQQVRALEAWLGTPLFRRIGGPPARLELTDDAAAALPDLIEGFDRLAAGLQRLKRPRSDKSIKVTAPPAFAAKWLMPRLGKFRDTYPEVDAQVEASDQLVDFAAQGVDIGVRFGNGRWRGLTSTHLVEEEIFPVCSPAFLSQHGTPAAPSDLHRFTLIHDTSIRFDIRFPGWSHWLRLAGAQNVDHHRGITINSSSAVTQSAIDGQGIALGRSLIVKDDLLAGRLVRLFEVVTCPTGWAYYIVHLPDAFERPKIVAFKEWLQLEMKIR